MRDFEWTDDLWCVVKRGGHFCGKPCTSYEEAAELQKEHEGSHIYYLWDCYQPNERED